MDQSSSEKRRDFHRFFWMFCCVLVGVALGAALMWWGAFIEHDRTRTAAIQRLNEQLGMVTLELNGARAERDVLENMLAVESSTRKGLERTLDRVQKELGAARDQIAFYHELLPPGPEGSISIRGFDVQQQGRLLRFRVLLMRNGAGEEPFEGMLQFEAQGELEGEPVTVILEPARLRATNGEPNMAVPNEKLDEADVSDVADVGTAADIGTAPDDDSAGAEEDGPGPKLAGSVLALDFDRFQRSTGLLEIPDGLELEAVTLNVLEGDTLRVSQSVDIPTQGLLH